MSSVAHPLQTAVPAAELLAPAVFVLLTGGLVGMSIRNMFESIMSEEDGEPGGDGSDNATMDGGDGLMAEGGGGDDAGDDLGGLGGLDDDSGDDLGGFDDDGFGEMDEGGDLDDLEHRLDEMEAEVGSLSSTVNTVRNENEQISESVQEVEENVRKLLDIYEMVTRGVNPFADDVNAGMGGGMGDGGGFGLFADEEAGGGEEALDQDLAEADAEGFFEEDLAEEEETLEANADVDEVFGDEDEDDDDRDLAEEFDDEFEEDFEDLEDGGGGGTSFEDLKEEYESGEAEWAEDEDELAEAFDEDALDDVGDDSIEDDDLGDDGIEDDDLGDEDVEDEAGDAASTAEATAAADQGVAGASGAGSAIAGAGASSGEGRPYLASLPDGFAGDLLVVEWLEYLVGEAGVRETARAIDYYESIDWIDEAVADDLQDYLAGFDGGGSASLSIDHHTRSLQYIAQLDGGGADAVAAARLSHGGGSDGIQR